MAVALPRDCSNTTAATGTWKTNFTTCETSASGRTTPASGIATEPMSWPVYEILLSISSAEPKFPSPNLYSVPPGIEITCSVFSQGGLPARNNELALLSGAIVGVGDH